MTPKTRPGTVPLALLLGAVLLAGCEGYVKRGSALYAERRYIEAAEVFERTEARLQESSPQQRAEYGLYRGLTFMVLGDLPSAHRWLAYAQEVERTSPGALPDDRRAQLEQGWSALGQKINDARGPLHPAPNNALATSPLPQSEPLPAPATAPASGNAVERRSFLPE
jgi:tetratricopeptide (TPR) repeat protein